MYTYNYNIAFYFKKFKINKKVTFQYNSKKYDGTSEKNTIYFNLITNYFNNKIETDHDILYIVKNKEYLIYCLHELKKAQENLYESILQNLTSYEYNKPSAPIIRDGSRDYGYKFYTEDIKQLSELEVVLKRCKQVSAF